jgi:hypothetical protein
MSVHQTVGGMIQEYEVATTASESTPSLLSGNVPEGLDKELEQWR